MKLEINSERWLSLENLEGEIWKDIVGYEGLYQVSSFGRVKSLSRTIQCKNNRRCSPYTISVKEKIRKCYYDKKDGYGHVSLSNTGNSMRFPLHRLVALAFLENPNGYPVVNHKDENPSNNNVDNLEWCTYAYNNEYSNIYEKAYQTTRKPVYQFSLDGKFMQEFISTKEAARIIGGDATNISACCHGRTNSMYGYYWRFKGDCDKKIGKAKLTRVTQYDLNDNAIQTFDRITYASTITGISVSSIIDSIRRGSVSAKKYRWRKEPIAVLDIPT